jgi:hypothetical protein
MGRKAAGGGTIRLAQSGGRPRLCRSEWGEHTACYGGDAWRASRLGFGSDMEVYQYPGTAGAETGLCNIHYKQNLAGRVDCRGIQAAGGSRRARIA